MWYPLFTEVLYNNACARLYNDELSWKSSLNLNLGNLSGQGKISQKRIITYAFMVENYSLQEYSSFKYKAK